MAKFVYRGHRPAKSSDGKVTVRFGEIVNEDHIAVKEAWAHFYPVSSGPEVAPDTANEATTVVVDESLGFEPEDREIL